MSENAIRKLLAENLRQLMEVHGIKTAVEMGNRSGVSDRMIGYILQQKRAASVETLDLIAKAFRMKAYQLLIDKSHLSDSEAAEEVSHYVLDSETLDLFKGMTKEELAQAENYAKYILSQRRAPPSTDG